MTGIIVAAVQGSGKAVKVAPVSNMNSGGWSSGSEISDYGTVTTNMNQDIYYDDSLTVKEVYVKVGDTVKIGDRLVAYDTTLATMEKEMKQMEIEGIALNRKNIEAELKQLRGTKAVAKGDATGADPVVKTSATETKAVAKGNVAGTNTVVKASAAGTDAVVNADTGKSRTTASVQRQNMTAREGNTDTGTAGSDQDSTVTDGKETGKPFPEELKGTKIYDKITEESVPYNEDGDGTEEKPYRYLCAPGVTVHAQFMLKVLENREICTFEVVDDKDNPTRILYEWTLDGKNGQIIKPVQPDQPDTPSEPDVPDEPDTPSEPEDPSEPDDPGISDGPTKEELAKEIQEKEERLKELELEQRTAELELKQLKKKVDNAIVTSTVEGTVKSVTDEETARLENTPIISVVGEDGFYVTGRVAETAFDKIKEGMTVTVTSWTSGMTYEATISGVSSSPLTGYSDGNNENLSYYPFTAVIHGDAELSNGDGVDLSIDDLSSQDEDEIYLEQMFVREDGNQYYVYKKGDNGKLKKQYVEVGKNVSGSLEIVSGLSLDDEIAFPYGRDVREGAKTKSTDTLYDYK